MFKRRKAKKLAKLNRKELAGKTADVAGKAAVAARSASHKAAPVLRKQAQTAAGSLSEAAERAAEILAETADRLSSSEASAAARAKLADRAEAFADLVRPRKKHRIRKLFFLGAIVTAVVAFLKSPLRHKLTGGDSTDTEPEAITLPSAKSETKNVAPSEVAKS